MFRYVRRSCRPNTEIQTIITDGTNYHFCFMATKDLQSGEEITVAWQTDDTIKAMYAERGVVHGDVPADIKHAIAMWVSNVLANCGPCACNGDGCLMARFDRRGQPQPIEPPETAVAPLKVPKVRRKKTNNLSPADPNRNSHSRSGSEVRKVEVEDDMTDTRSVSGSFRASASRDITPGTHYSAVIPEMSEREKKKLMREEEMFKRQEEESGRQKKKRHSGATPLLPQSSTLSSSKQQSSEPSSSRRGTISKHPSKPSTSNQQSSEPSRPVYVDSSIQCDMDNDDPPEPQMPTPPKKKQYLSVTQRLLRRCASNNLKRKAESETPDASPTNGIDPEESMDIGNDEQSPRSVGAPSEATPLSPVSIKHADVNMTEAEQARPAPLSPAFGAVDTDMRYMDDSRATPPPNDQQPSSSYSSASPTTLKSGIPSHPPMDPPPPPWPQKEAPSIGEVHPASPEFKAAHAEMHLTMPPSLNSATSLPLTQSPAIMTPGLSNIPLFSPSVSAAVNPSPARKKLSLSDYTKRNKVHQPRDISPAASLTDSISAKDKDSILNGVAVTDSPASEQAMDATAAPLGSQESVVPSA
ncbi:hypothetical protein E4T45_12219 [Aureobasidium sp. EXF-8846]|nr:hypothetical protein E4T45_12219 [Aureobasidium sp. EXF-8846]